MALRHDYARQIRAQTFALNGQASASEGSWPARLFLPLPIHPVPKGSVAAPWIVGASETGAHQTPDATPSRSLSRRWAAKRMDSATIVKSGLAYPDVGKTEPPTTKRSSTSCDRQLASTTPFRDESLIRVVPS